MQSRRDGAPSPLLPRGALDLSATIPWGIHLVTCLLLLLVGVRVRAYAIANHDVAWLLVAAERWLGGATLGTDIVEINTPAALLLYVPPVWLADMTGISVLIWVNIWIAALALLCAALAGRIVAHVFEQPGNSRQAFLTTVMIGAVLLFYPTYDFGQREHVVAALLLPYGIMATATRDWRDHRRLSGIVAIFAACAVCIKPQFILILAVVFMLNLRRSGWRQAIARTHAVSIAAIGAIYVLIVVVAFPDWLAMAQAAGRLYVAYESSFGSVLNALVMSGLMVLAAVLIATLELPGRAVLANLVILSVAVLLLYLVQSKGWQYHQLPAHLFIWSGLAVMFVASLPRLAALSKAPWAIVLAVLLLPACLTERARLDNGAERIGYESSDHVAAIRALARPGDGILYLSASLPPAFPLVLEEGLIWRSHYPCLWPLAGAMMLDPVKVDDAALAKSVIDGVAANLAQDIANYRPHLIVVDMRQLKPHLPDGFQFLPLLMRYPAFKDAWQAYASKGVAGSYEIFVRQVD